MTRIKICGLSRLEDVAGVNAAMPDFAGFVMNVPGSRRSIGIETLKRLSPALDPAIIPVGVFVDAPRELIIRLFKERLIRVVQLHGSEDETYIQELLKDLCPGDGPPPVIRAFKVTDAKDVARANACSAPMVLLDGGAGDGKCFDWSLLKEVRRPFMLAGGLNVQNLAQALDAVSPWAVDLSSGAETEGVKDREKIMQLVSLVRLHRRPEDQISGSL